MNSQLPLKKSPMTQKVLNFLARSLVLAIGLGNMSVTSEKEVIQQPTWLLHRERAPESPQSRGGGAEESHPVGTDISDMQVPIHHSLSKLTPRPTSWKKCHFSMKSYELRCPQSHQLCSPYFGRAYEELTSSYIRDTRDDRSFSPLRTRPCWLTQFLTQLMLLS